MIDTVGLVVSNTIVPIACAEVYVLPALSVISSLTSLLPSLKAASVPEIVKAVAETAVVPVFHVVLPTNIL